MQSLDVLIKVNLENSMNLHKPKSKVSYIYKVGYYSIQLSMDEHNFLILLFNV